MEKSQRAGIVESHRLVSIFTVSVSPSKPSLVLIRYLRFVVALYSLVVIKYYDNDYDLKALGRRRMKLKR